MKEVIAIGDIHGNYLTLLALVDKIKLQFPEGEIVFCADLVDRGPRSKEVVQYVIDNNLKSCRGNHEAMLYTDVLGNSSPYIGDWYAYHGTETLESYKNETGIVDMELLKKHANWMKDLPLFLEFKDCKNKEDRYLVVSHSNVGSVWKWSEQKRKEMKDKFEDYIMWERNGFNDNKEIYNIVGHSPCKDGPKIRSFFANIDTGACFKKPGYGILTALAYPSMSIITQENID